MNQRCLMGAENRRPHLTRANLIIVGYERGIVDGILWSREGWDASISAKAYNSDWWDSLTPEKEPSLWAEIRSIFEDENSISGVPE